MIIQLSLFFQLHSNARLSPKMTSMAATLAASLPALPAAKSAAPATPAPAKVPQRMEGVVDPEALRDVESIQLNSLVRLKHIPKSTTV
jgi:translation initiation factor 3 subunit H